MRFNAPREYTSHSSTRLRRTLKLGASLYAAPKTHATIFAASRKTQTLINAATPATSANSNATYG
jgi:hypothetical protein